jgi:hypothetical protein
MQGAAGGGAGSFLVVFGSCCICGECVAAPQQLAGAMPGCVYCLAVLVWQCAGVTGMHVSQHMDVFQLTQSVCSCAYGTLHSADAMRSMIKAVSRSGLACVVGLSRETARFGLSVVRFETKFSSW